MAEAQSVFPAARPQSAFLIKLTDEAWEGLLAVAQNGAEGLSITLGKDGSLNIPGAPFFGLDSTAVSPPVEIHEQDGTSLALLANATKRLQIPLTKVPTALQDKLRSSTDAAEQARKDRKLQVLDAEPSKRKRQAGLRDRLVSSRPIVSRPGTPAMPSRANTPAASVPTSSGAVIPLKTRVMQLLALGPKSAKDVVARVGGGEDEVARVLKVVATPTGAQYSLLPLQYAKIKVSAWPAYTRVDQLQVQKLAKAAFDKMGLSAGADERAAFDAACKPADGSAAASVPLPNKTLEPAVRAGMTRSSSMADLAQSDVGVDSKPAKALPTALSRTAQMTRSSSLANNSKPVKHTDVASNGKRKRSEDDEEIGKPVGSAVRKLRAEGGPIKRSSSMPVRVSEADYSSSDDEQPSAAKLRARYEELLPEQARVEDEIRRLKRWLEKIASGRNSTEGEYVDMARAGEDVQQLVQKRAKVQDELQEIREWFTD